ncbi:hypothetical protein [Sphingomonas sp. CFBP 8764]|uniref:hypothetical protein n=1 Tax=Sphingomonas sp. CFBP 8764 TaxID=2775275 RepID=UPI00177D0813|nr:hypothetical protein [Sphingomonas sp. CFBP 8764]MBD8551817.1 hypothetical protein [Sphingomonas sp. CFBP 8764]
MDTTDNKTTNATTSAKLMKKASGIAYAYLCNAFDDAQDDPCVDYRLMGRIAAVISRQIDDDAVHAASTLDGARMVLALWCMTVEEARDDPEQPVTTQSAWLAHSIATGLGVPHLLRGTTNSRRDYDVCRSVEVAALLRGMFDGDTQLDRDLASVGGWPESGSAVERTIAAISADVKAGHIVAPSSHSDGEWWQRAEAADRKASMRVFPQKNFERVLEPLLYEDLTPAGQVVLARLNTMKTSRSRADSWEEQAVNLTSRYICYSLSQQGWRMERERLAAAAGRHFDAMAVGEEHAATIVDSARMILIDWSVTSDRLAAAGSVLPLSVARDRATRALEDAGLGHLSARDEPQLRPQGLHEQVRDAARRAVSLDWGTKLDVDLHRFNDSLVVGNVAASGRVAVQRAADRGFVHPLGETAAGVASWAERQVREAETRVALDEATSALQGYRARYTPPAPPIIYLGNRGRAGFEPDELAAFEPHVAHPGERVRFSSPERGASGAMTIAETLALRGSDGRLVAWYRVDGDDHDYGDEDLVRLGRRHTDGGRGLLDRATWTPPTKRLGLVARRAMNAGMTR